MAGLNLTRTAFFSRKLIVYGSLGLVAVSVLIFLFGIFVNVLKQLNPPPPKPPTKGFGRLQDISFPKQSDVGEFTFTLEMPEGKLPDMPNQAKVYFIPQPSSGFLNLNSARQNAAGIGFTDNPRKVNDTTYEWSAGNGRSLSINIITGDLSYSLDLLANPDILKNPRLLSPDEALQAARSFLSSARSLPSDLSPTTFSYTYLKPFDSKLVPAISPSETQFILVSFQRRDYDKFQVFPANPKKGPAWVLVSNSNDQNTKVLNAEYHFFPADEGRFETYPIKLINQAWKELTSGQYYLAHIDEQHGTQIAIRRVDFGYFEPGNTSEYLQPIYRFTGDNNFTAYVSALDPGSLVVEPTQN